MRHRWRRSGVSVATASMLAVALAACGSDEQEGALPSPVVADPSAPLPATTLLVAPAPSGEPVTNVEGVAVSERCPESTLGSSQAADDQELMLAEQSRLEPMLGSVVAYGGEHPDEFVTYGMVWHRVGDASVFASFVSDLDTHRAALGSLVDFPDDLIVCQAPVTADVAAAIESTLLTELEGRFVGIGRGANGLTVALRAQDQELAEQLDTRYGDAIELTVGSLRYPIDDAVSVCEPVPVGDELDGLDIEIEPLDGPVAADEYGTIRFTAILTNAGTTPIEFSSGTSQGVVLDGAGRVVSTRVETTLEATVVTVDPGSSTTVPVIAGTASCDPAVGYELPPDDYTLVAVIPYLEAGAGSTLLSAPTSFTLAD